MITLPLHYYLVGDLKGYQMHDMLQYLQILPLECRSNRSIDN
jgi:hypothetical protein